MVLTTASFVYRDRGPRQEVRYSLENKGKVTSSGRGGSRRQEGGGGEEE